MTLPPWDLIRSALLTVLLPGFVASAVVLGLVRWLTGPKRAAVFGPALAVFAGLAAGNALRHLFPWVPEEVVWHRVPFAAVAALAVEAIVRLPRLPEAGRLALRFIGAGAVAATIIPAEVWTGTPWAGFILAAGVVAGWLLPVRLAQKSPGGAVSLSFALLLGGGAAVVLIHAHSARFTDAATLLAASLAGVAVVAWPGRLDDGSAVPAAAAFVPGLAAAGWTETFSEVPTAAFLLVAAAPLALAVSLAPPVSRWPGPRLLAVSAAALAVPVLTAVVLAMRAETLDFGY
jgi:hypothetical protein